MQALTLKSHVGPDGILKLQVPVKISNADLEVMLIVQPNELMMRDLQGEYAVHSEPTGLETAHDSTMMVDTREIPLRLKELLALVASGKDVVFIENDTPVARLVALAPRVAGLHSGTIWTSDDFDEPLPEQFWTGDS